jgi:hypothetical protein
MSRMSIRPARASQRFKWSVFHGRCRRNLLVGLVLCLVAGAYGTWAAHRLATRGADARAFDRPLVSLAQSLVRPPAGVRAIRPQNIREFYLLTAVSDQRDVLEGLTVFLLRLIIVMTAGALGIVLLTAGATEWEIRSSYAAT